jgi:circadian clock protein KaiC
MTTTTIPLDSIQATRLHLRNLMKIIKEENSTTMVTTEIPEGSRDLSRDSVSEFLVDGIIVLGLDTTMGRRKLTIRKMRGTKHALKPMDVEITENGIKLQ